MHVGALRAWEGKPPVGIKIVIEGQEEVGSAFTTFPPSRPDLFDADAMVIGDMGSFRPGRADAHGRLRGMAMVTVEARTLAGPKHSGQFGGAAPDALIALLHALASLHDEHGDVAVPGLRREEWTGAAYTDDEFRELAEIEPGVPLLRHRRARRADLDRAGGDRHGHRRARRSTRRVNAVVPYARAKVSLRVHPEQNPVEAQRSLIDFLEGLHPFGVSLTAHAGETGTGFAAETSGPAYTAARDALASAWGGETVTFASGGSIPLVNALQEAVPDGRDAPARDDGRVRQHPRAERARAARRVREGGARRGGVLRPLRRDRHRHGSGCVSEAPAVSAEAQHSFLERMLDGIERLGNKMPDPAILFLLLCGVVIVLSQVLYWFDVKATYEVVKPPPAPADRDLLRRLGRADLRRPECERAGEALPRHHGDDEGQGPADR